MNVRITGSEQTIVAEVRPVSADIRTSPSRIYFWYSAGGIHESQGGYSGKPLNGTYSEYYLNKNIKAQGFFKDGLKNGIWNTWGTNSKLTEVLTYKDGQKNGRFSKYDEAGKLIQAGNYSNDLLSGKILTYRADSVSVSVYKNGKLVPPKTGPSFWNKINILKKKKGGQKPKTAKAASKI